MAQLSTDTLVYSQIIAKVQKFINDYMQEKSISPKAFDKAYQELLFDIHNKIGGSSTDLHLLNKGDAPTSSVFNQMISTISKDLNMITNQFDSVSANYINTFNLFSNQIEAEKNFISRIKSKINVLEMYSGSSSVDITYLGDSFTDLSYVDARAIRTGLVPDITDGYATLAKGSSRKWNNSPATINQNYNESTNTDVSFVSYSNGLKGNHFLYHRDSDKNEFLYEKDSALLRSTESAIVDGSPATYFEYEAVNVLAEGLSSSGKLKPSYEFEYFDGTKYINWGKFDITKPLRLTLQFTSQAKTGEYINHISIVPFFGYDIEGANALIKNIKVTSIKLFDETKNTTYELINNGPVYIASDVSTKNVDNYKQFFYNKGVFRFDERKVNKIYITFEQSQFNDTTIKHAYWTPYEIGKDTKWNNQVRFEPEAILSSKNQTIAWDKNALIPNINKPEEFKSSSSDIKQVAINYATQVTSQSKYQLKITSGKNVYYWSKRDPDTGADLFTTKQLAPTFPTREGLDAALSRITKSVIPAACVLVDGTQSTPMTKLRIKMKTVSVVTGNTTITTFANHGLAIGDKVYIKDRLGTGTVDENTIDIYGIYTVSATPSVVQFSITTTLANTVTPVDIGQNFGSCYKVIDIPTTANMSIETYSDMINKTEKIVLNLKRNFEYLKAQRASIGIRDISFGKETFQDAAEIISKPFFINGQLDMLSIEAADETPESSSGKSYVKYYVSVDGGLKWIQISPVERNFSGVPEILAFNQNLNNDNTLPQIAYFNQPDVPNPINTVMVKIIMQKDRSLNNTPIVYYYKLGIRTR
jgi:hypothetical protein